MGSAVDDEAIQQNWEKYKETCAKAGLSAKHAHASATKGRAYCITDADSVESVQKAHDDANVPVNEIIEVKDLT